MTSTNEAARPVNIAARFRPGYEGLASIEAALKNGSTASAAAGCRVSGRDSFRMVATNRDQKPPAGRLA